MPLAEHDASVESQMSPAMAAGTQGFSNHETVTIGGQTPDGQDATNELPYVILEKVKPLYDGVQPTDGLLAADPSSGNTSSAYGNPRALESDRFLEMK